VSKNVFYAENFCLMTFISTQHALRAEKTLEKNKIIDFIIVPTPRDISNGCGLSIKFICEEQETIKELISDNDITYAGIYSFKKNEDNKNLVEKID